VTAALLLLAGALLCWPDPRTLRRSRLPGRTGSARPWPRLPVPLLAGVVAGAAGGVVGTPLVAVLAGGCAALGARSWAGRRAVAREDARLLELTDALGGLAAELRSGRTVEAVAAGGGELARALRSPAAGAPPSARAGPAEQALARVAAAVRLSARTGASLGGVVTAVEDDLRARHRQRLELRTATAGPRASAALLAGLPLLGLAMGSGVGADPWAVLTRTPTGQVLLVLGVGLELAGLAWSRRLVARAVGDGSTGDGGSGPRP
jgi:tight adherence protein B